MSVPRSKLVWVVPARLQRIAVTVGVVVATVLIHLQPAHADPAKLGNSCGCGVDASAVYGAGQDTCATYMDEYAANAEIRDDVDATFGQSLGWIAGYMSARNREAGVRDIYDMSLDYVAFWVAEWCEKNTEKTLLDAMEFLTEERSRITGVLPVD